MKNPKHRFCSAAAMAALLLSLLSCGGGRRSAPVDSGRWDGRAKGTYIVGVTWPDMSLLPTPVLRAIPTLWINGRKHEIRDLSDNGQFMSVFVSGDDAYAALLEYEQETGKPGFVNPIASLCKNGDRQELSKNAIPYSVFAVGGDVYVAGVKDAGTDNERAALWHNGAEETLGVGYSCANGVTVSDGDVYVAGSEETGGNTRATLWRNGTATRLGSEGADSHALSVSVSGGDVYVVGSEMDPLTGKTCGKLWRNGLEMHVQLPAGIGESRLSSVHVSGDGVYMAGEAVGHLPLPACWKNGELLWIDQEYGYSQSMFVADGTTYAVGFSVGIALLWENGERKYIEPQQVASSGANGIFVK